jgi:predicted dehydrogenase/threonine dehydrogenase-like Zn-dependent dehydrogenase
MKQVLQDFKTGELSVGDVDAPVLQPGFVLVRNHFSLISAGTERATVTTGQASLIGKARQRPDLVKQVMDTLKKEGLAATLTKVRTRLETLKELGYSTAGTVLTSLDTEGRFKPGDRVACGGGGYASHAGIVSVPQNLVVKVPDSVSLEGAAFATLGAIAMQGVRQAQPRIGDLTCVIGLGLLGQITAQILRANGCQVFGIDTSAEMVELGKTMGCHAAMARADSRLLSEIDAFAEGRGFDSVIITAATSSTDPVELSTAILRQKGVIVIVGAVPMNIPREPHFYKKELELKISCSYGPGRYDPAYEEEGHDYPYGHVRWTENRNMAAFIKLLENAVVDVRPLVSHVIDIDDAVRAYDIITGKVKERSLGILLKYPESEEARKPPAAVPPPPREGEIGIGLIGAGSFAQKFIIPNARAHGSLLSVVDSRGPTAKNVGQKFGFASASTDVDDILSNPAVNTVFIATHHDTHAGLVLKSLEAGKNVFVEKPLAIREDDLLRISDALRRRAGGRLMVGFNRRFAPLSEQAKKVFEGLSEPLLVNYRVNAGFIPKDHWIQREEGGGRILGEVCHFVDFLQFITGSAPAHVFAECLASSNTRATDRDNVAITLRLAGGSVGSIIYLANGDPRLPKERIEIDGGGMSVVIDDFKEGTIFGAGKVRTLKFPGKGHKEEIERFAAAIKQGLPSPIPFESIRATTETTFRVLDSLRTGLPQAVGSAPGISALE